MSSPTHLFVYGSLLVGTAPAEVERELRRCTRALGDGWISARLYDLGPYPAALPAAGPSDRVYGALFALVGTGDCLRTIDAYEAYDPHAPAASEFVRHEILVHRSGRVEALPAWAYFFNGRVRFRPRIASGDYRQYLADVGRP